jgi:hypothetical protein
MDISGRRRARGLRCYCGDGAAIAVSTNFEALEAVAKEKSRPREQGIGADLLLSGSTGLIGCLKPD